MAMRREKASISSLKLRQQRQRKILRRGLQLETLEDRRVFAAPQLVAINPNTGDFFNLAGGANVRNIAPRELVFRFNEGQVIDPATVTLAANNVRVVRAGTDGALGTADDIVITPGYVGLGEAPNEVVVRFSENLQDDKYRITLVGAGANPIRNQDIPSDPLNNGEAFNNGTNRSVDFELDLGAQVTAIVPQPVDYSNGLWSQRSNQIDIYFNNDDLNPALAQNVNFYKLIFTNDTVNNTDDLSFTPTSAVYSATLDKVTLTFSAPLHQLGAGSGTFRLRIGTNESIPTAPTQTNVAVDPGDSFGTSRVLGTLGPTGLILSSTITSPLTQLDFPGATDEPGHRDVPVAESHHGDNPTSGVPRYFYNFSSTINGFANFITEAQKQRAREIFQLYEHYLGIDFVESATQGITVATADLAALGGVSGPGAVAGLGGGGGGFGAAVMDVADSWNDDFGGSWFTTAMHEIGHAIGFGHTYDLPPGTIMGSDGDLGTLGGGSEPVFPGLNDIVHGQYLYRPDSNDIDLYRFDITTTGSFTAETFAERLAESSSLNTVIRLYRESAGVRTLVAQNDDYFSNDSFLKLKLTPGTYYIGVSSTGNDDYDPTVANSGMGGTSRGNYQLRLNFRADVTNTLADTTGVAFDGDLDGVAGGVHDFWFKVADPSVTRFVDKTAPDGGNGTLGSPYNNIQAALATAPVGSVVRILGNGGADKNLLTTADTVPYLIGSDQSGNALADGRNLDVPQGVTVMIDAGAVFKMRRGTISVGSSTPTPSGDRSGGALQVLGTPVQSVIFTSFNDDTFSGDTNGATTPAAPGNWGGIIFQNDIDNASQRFNYEQQGIFLNYVNHADIRYGGGSVSLNGVETIVAPIYMAEARPTITFNTITLSADAAMSADPNSFEETNFHAPIYQRTGVFTSDYDRVGPDIYGNRLYVTETINNVTTSRANSQNGLFIRISTPAGGALKKITTQARFDDLDIVHIIAENLVIEGTPGGGLQDSIVPDLSLVTTTPGTVGTLVAGTYTYVMTFVDSNGNETPASLATTPITIAGAQDSIRLGNLPAAPAGYTARRIYRSVNGSSYQLVSTIVTNTTFMIDNGATEGGALPLVGTGIRARTDARLAIDPGVIVKMNRARIEASIGAQFLAEGTAALPVVITSINDDRYGAGGTFDQTGTSTPNTAVPGDWGGIFLGPVSSGSVDHAVIAYGGGVVRVAGSDTGYNVFEVYQAQSRLTRSVLEYNANGRGGQAPANRFGAGANAPATIFVRGAQPIIVDNIIRNNAAAAININVNSLDHQLVTDYGRSTGAIDRIDGFNDNHGALVRLNRLLNNGINGMVIRGETIQTESVWDDTDITHVLLDTINIPNFHTFTGLRIQSSQNESLVVKLFGPNAGITATGKPMDIDDRIGGILHILGQPGRPVIFTSLRDDTVGAGKRPDGRPQTDTNNDGAATVAAPGDWRSLIIDQYAHDRNVDAVVEAEPAGGTSPGSNSTPAQAQSLGGLAPNETSADENLRLGYVVYGLLNAPSDVDVYSFQGKAGTEIWLDIDQTSTSLDSVLELIDANGVLLARSNNSFDEARNITNLVGIGMKMQKTPPFEGIDYWSTNPKDPGMRLVLPGAPGTTNTYYVRVRSNSANLADLSAGQTAGNYQLQVRLHEVDEKAGTTIRYSNISYATNGIEVYGQPGHSPLTGEGGENLANNDSMANATNLGNILNTDRMAMSIAGSLGKDVQGLPPNLQLADVDFYRFDLRYSGTQQIGGITSGSIFSTIFDVDYAARVLQGDLSLWLFDATGTLVLSNRTGNVADDLPRAGRADDGNDLTRGSMATYDPFIGAQVLPEGTYYVAVTAGGAAGSGSVVPSALQQSQIRFEPVNSLVRIAEDHIGSSGGSTAAPPVVDRLIDNTSAVPYFLGDVVLYVSQQRAQDGTTSGLSSRILTVNPFTGAVQTVVNSNLNDSRTSFSLDISDMAMRADGSIYAFTVDNDRGGLGRADGTSGNYLLIDSGTGVATIVGDDGLVTYESNGAAPPAPVVANLRGNPPTRIGYGVQFNAMTFYIDGNGNERLFAIGNRGDSPEEGVNGVNAGIDKNNLMFEFNTATGAVQYPYATVGLGRAATSHIPFGNFDAVMNAGEVLTGMIQVPNAGSDRGGLIYAVSNQGRLFTITPNIGFAGATIAYVQTSADDLDGIEFTSVTLGPQATEGGRYSRMLFATAADGRIYAFDLQGRLQPVFANGATSIATGITSLNGLVFGETESNLWGQTSNRGGDAGHGINPSFDGSRDPQAGGASYYFGDQNGFNYSLTGGAHGTLITNEFSLKGYSASDQPMVYLNYYMQGDGSADAFKVFAGGDDGNWILLGAPTNTAPAATTTGSGGVWRQIRVPLAAVAGQEHVRLRFDFSTAGDMNVGDIFTTGEELRAVNGYQIQDGELIQIGGVTYEFERGITVLADSGAAMRDGDTFSLVTDAGTYTYEMNSTGGVTGANRAVNFTAVMTPAQVANAIRNAILATPGIVADGVTVFLREHEVNIKGLTDYVPSVNTSVRFTGDVGVDPANVPIDIDLLMNRNQVATVIDAVLEQTLVEQRLVFQAGTQYTDGETFTLTDGTTSFTFEFNDVTLGNGVTGDNVEIPFDPATSTARSIAATFRDIVVGAGLPTYSARIDSFDLRRVAIVKATPTLPNLTVSGSPDVTFQVVTDVSKQYKDLIRVIGHEVNDPGPLGFEFTSLDPYPNNDPNEAFYQNRGVGVALAGDALSYPYYDPSMAGLTNRRVGFNSPTRHQANNFEGFYLDDIIIGFADRGELVTGGTPNANFDYVGFGPALTPAVLAQIQAAADAISFPYQLEIRSGEDDYAEGGAPAVGSATKFVDLLESYDTNHRLATGYQLQAPAGSRIVDGQWFTISDGINTVRFEFDDYLTTAAGVTQGSQAILFSSADPDYVIAARIRNAINGAGVQSLLSSITASLSDGELVGTTSTDNRINLTGPASVDLSGSIITPVNQPPAGIAGTTSTHKGDTNRFRDQGQIILAANVISHALQYGMVLDAGDRNSDLAPNAGVLPHPGVVRNLRTVNTDRLVPGVVAMNNIVSSSGQGGIHISGDPNTGGPTQLAPIPFARIINNTIYGADQGVGILVDQNASPTLINNIVANLDVGVSVDGSSSSTVLTGMLYKDNTVNTQGVGLGSFALALATTDPLFINPAAGNFYLAAGSKAIDSSVDSLADRNNYLNYKAQVGIGASPILAPQRDVAGQLRQDDPSIEAPAGIGENVFKDRGALDRVDFAGPTAVLTTPRDNDANGLDQEPALGDVVVNGVDFPQFTIQLLDGLDPFEAQNGAGIDDATVVAATIKVTRNGTLLVQGVDYTFSYDAVNDTLTLVPLSGLWSLGSYEITLDNTAETGIKDLAGNGLKSNRVDGKTIFKITLAEDTTGSAPYGIDFGDAPEPKYPSSISSNGPRHIIVPGFQLGATVSAETNARPNNTDSGDDGVVFVSGTTMMRGRMNAGVEVTASQAGKLDAWIDFNGNGTFESNEKIFQQDIAAGTNTLFFDIPASAAVGTTYARFRFSSTGNLGPNGVATDGEVEDYSLSIVANPWQNPAAANNPLLALDVSGDGKVSPIDALLVINRLNAQGPGALPTPMPGDLPPYLDVNGDGFLGPADAALIINHLNTVPSAPSGEGEDAGLLATSESFAAASTTSVIVGAGDAGGESSLVEDTNPSTVGMLLLPEAAGEDTSLASSLADEAPAASMAASSASAALDLIFAEESQDDEDDLALVLGSSTMDEAADDFFGWFGQ